MGAAVHERRVGLDRPREDAEDVDAARERVGDGLEHERGGARAVDRQLALLLRRRRYALDEQVEKGRRAEVLRRDAAGDREELTARDRVLEGVRDLLFRELLAVEIALH